MREKKHGARVLAALILAACLGSANPALGQESSAHEGHDDALSALMQRNRDHFTEIVQTAYFVSLDRPLARQDFERLRKEAQAVSDIGRQVRTNHSQGPEFEEIAADLQEHAEAAARAASEENLPDFNTEVGEMAEYCAKCHNAFRWQSG